MLSLPVQNLQSSDHNLHSEANCWALGHDARHLQSVHILTLATADTESTASPRTSISCTILCQNKVIIKKQSLKAGILVK